MGKLIFIDPGHGGQDPGAVGNGLVEKVLTWEFCNVLQGILQGWDCRTRLVQPSTWMDSTGKDELTLPVKLANEGRADLFLSVHVNAGGGSGFESFVYQGGKAKEG